METRRRTPRVETAKRESASIRSYSRDFIPDKILVAATTSDWRATDIFRGRLRDKPRSNAGIERRVATGTGRRSVQGRPRSIERRKDLGLQKPVQQTGLST